MLSTQRSEQRSEVSYISTSFSIMGLAAKMKRLRRKACEDSCPGEEIKKVIFSSMTCMFLLISYNNNQTYIATKMKSWLLLLIQHLPDLAHLVRLFCCCCCFAVFCVFFVLFCFFEIGLFFWSCFLRQRKQAHNKGNHRECFPEHGVGLVK